MAPIGTPERPLQVHCSQVEQKLRIWIDHLCRIEGRTVKQIAVRSVEYGRETSPYERLDPATLFAVFQALALWCQAEIIPCNYLSVINKKTISVMKHYGWDVQFRGQKPKLHAIRVGILANFCDDPELPVLNQQRSEIVATRMREHTAELNQLIAKYTHNGDSGNETELDHEFADKLLLLAARVSIDPHIPIEFAAHKKTFIDQVIKIAEAASRHCHRKLDGKLTELEFPEKG